MYGINESLQGPWAITQPMSLAIKNTLAQFVADQEAVDLAAGLLGEANEPIVYEVSGDVVRIPIYGFISKRDTLIGRLFGGCVAITEIQRCIDKAMSDAAVKKILLDIDSPGGSVDGVLDLSDFIFSLRGQKEIIAYANGQMCSAAYWLGSAANKIYASRGAMIGSIGIYAVVSDWTVAKHKAGINTEVIIAGKNKAVGHPDRPFTQEAREVIQERVDEVYDLFVAAVARNRSMSTEDVLKIATGDIFLAQDAKAIKLIDDIKPLRTFYKVVPKAQRIKSVLPAPAASDTVHNQMVISLPVTSVPDHKLQPSANITTPRSESGKDKAVDQKLSIEEQCKKDWENNPKLRDEWVSLEAYTGYTRGVAKGRIKVYPNRESCFSPIKKK